MLACACINRVQSRWVHRRTGERTADRRHLAVECPNPLKIGRNEYITETWVTSGSSKRMDVAQKATIVMNVRELLRVSECPLNDKHKVLWKTRESETGVLEAVNSQTTSVRAIALIPLA
jgi:hypothetical protein